MNDPLTESLPKVRCTAELKRKLEIIATHSVTPRMTDHIRFAVEKYIVDNWRKEYADQATPTAASRQ